MLNACVRDNGHYSKPDAFGQAGYGADDMHEHRYSIIEIKFVRQRGRTCSDLRTRGAR